MDHARSFGSVAAEYERGRPGYPPALLEWTRARLGAVSGPLVDLGAGTGKLTRLVTGISAVVAIEPSLPMAEMCAALAPDAAVVGARAEELPIADRSAAAVVCAQAFHWFATPEVVAELARVLRPGGELVLVWNEHLPSDPAHRRLIELEAELRPAGVTDGAGPWRKAFDGSPFSPDGEATFRHGQVTDAAGLLDRAASMSVFSTLDEPTRAEVFSELSRLVVDDRVNLGYEALAVSYSLA